MQTIEFTPLELTRHEQVVHELALSRAQDHFETRILLLESIDEVDKLRLFEKFRLTSTFA